MKSWLKKLSNWASYLWGHETTTSTINGVTSYSYKTVSFMFEQIGVIPKVLHSMVQKPPTHAVANHLFRIVAEDLVPLVLVSVTNDYIQTRGKDYLDDNPESAWLSTDSFLQMSLYLLQAATWAYSVRKKTQLMVRATIVTLEAPSLLNQMKNTAEMTVCIDEKCSSLRFAQGSVRDLAAYWSTEAAIACIGYLPVGGGVLASALSVYHRGRYVLAIALPNVCNRHQLVYLQEYSELALSLGVGQVASAWLIQSFVETLTGIPPVLYRSAMEQFLLIAQMSVTTHLILPQAPSKSTRRLLDPVFLYQQAVGFTFDLLLLGLKIKIPRMLDGKHPGVNMKEFFRHIPELKVVHATRYLHDTRIARLFLPRLLHSTDAFIHDPIIRYHWPQVQAMLINTFKTIEDLRDHVAIKASSSMPEVSSALVTSLFGTPKYITKLLLQLVTDDEFIELIRTSRYAIENRQLEAPMPVLTTLASNILPMRAPVRSAAPLAIMPPPPVSLPIKLPAPEDVIRKRNGQRFFIAKDLDNVSESSALALPMANKN